jgi:hypothetical protein
MRDVVYMVLLFTLVGGFFWRVAIALAAQKAYARIRGTKRR